MTRFTIAVAQSSSKRGDIVANVRDHCAFISAAAQCQADMVVFPELSLTGYEPDIASESTVDITDKRLDPIKELAIGSDMTVVVGAPLINPGHRPHIGALIIGPDRCAVYAKQHLHDGEEAFFLPGNDCCVVKIGAVTVGMAICADIAHESHARQAVIAGANIYAAGVLITREGFASDAALLQGYAKEHQMAVAMANYCQPTGGWIPSGKSALWDERGQLIVMADETTRCLVVAEKNDAGWGGSIVEVPDQGDRRL